MVEIRTAAEQLATEQQERAASATRVQSLVEELETKLAELSELAATRDNGNGNGSPAVLGALAQPLLAGNGAEPRETVAGR
jgi:hypothetical protein